MPQVRLQKILAGAGLGSRREAEEWIREGRVQVNGRTASLGDQADPETDFVRLDGKRVRAPSGGKTYILLNKPRGYVTTMGDPESRDTVMDLLPGSVRRAVKPVGRLDVQTEGLILLTDDGDLARRVTHPGSGCPKEYVVKVSGIPEEADLERLRRGMFLDGRRTRACEIDRTSTTGKGGRGNAWLAVTLREGRSRQIRRMFERIGHPVSKLKRVAIGPIRDSKLARGSSRPLSPAEVRTLRESLRPATGGGALAARRGPAPRPRRDRQGVRETQGPPTSFGAILRSRRSGQRIAAKRGRRSV